MRVLLTVLWCDRVANELGNLPLCLHYKWYGVEEHVLKQ